MTLTIHNSFLPHTDPDASIAFYRDALGFEVRLDVGKGDIRWVTVGPAIQPDTAVVLHPIAASHDDLGNMGADVTEAPGQKRDVPA